MVLKGTNVFGDTFHRSSFTLYLTNLEVYSQTPETNSYAYIFCDIFIFTYFLHTELFFSVKVNC